MTTKITSKGQITIPASIRRKLKTSILEIYFDGEKIILKPLKELGGILSKYAMRGKDVEEIMKLEKEVASDGFTGGDG